MGCYVGQTGRHLQFRLGEHKNNEGPVKRHFNSCNEKLTEDHVRILHTTSRDEKYLLALEALYIREIKPSINTKDEYRKRELKISAFYMQEVFLISTCCVKNSDVIFCQFFITAVEVSLHWT